MQLNYSSILTSIAQGGIHIRYTYIHTRLPKKTCLNLGHMQLRIKLCKYGRTKREKKANKDSTKWRAPHNESE